MSKMEQFRERVREVFDVAAREVPAIEAPAVAALAFAQLCARAQLDTRTSLTIVAMAIGAVEMSIAENASTDSTHRAPTDAEVCAVYAQVAEIFKA